MADDIKTDVEAKVDEAVATAGQNREGLMRPAYSGHFVIQMEFGFKVERQVLKGGVASRWAPCLPDGDQDQQIPVPAALLRMGDQVTHESVNDLLPLNVPAKAWRQSLRFTPIFPVIDNSLNIAEALQPEARISAHLEQAVSIMEMHGGFGRLGASQTCRQDQHPSDHASLHPAHPSFRLRLDPMRPPT
jgi:hypothetical protein